jgi:hypothetical protein
MTWILLSVPLFHFDAEPFARHTSRDRLRLARRSGQRKTHTTATAPERVGAIELIIRFFDLRRMSNSANSPSTPKRT